MISHLPHPGAAISCTRDGIILNVLQDEIGIGELARIGAPLESIVDSESRQKAQWFFRTLVEENVAGNWELNVRLEGRPVPLHFAGVASEEIAVVVIAGSRSGLARIYEELMRINNEQTNMFRQVMKEQAVQARRQAERSNELYDELSRLNNELATTQRELAKKNSELARLNDQKNQFLGMAAHDLRNPLSLILTYADFVLEESSDLMNEEQVSFVDAIKSSSRFMLGLVDDLLDVSKIEAGRLDLDLVPIDLAELVERNVAVNRILAEAKKIAIDLHLTGEAHPIPLDAGKIEQVLNNLIGNAIKFSEPGSTIDVHVGRSASGASVAVQDHGQGMSEKEVASVFTPFQRGRRAGTRGEKGSGLGLAIVRRIVEGHGGAIDVQSTPEVGSTFTVTFPVSAPSASITAERES